MSFGVSRAFCGCVESWARFEGLIVLLLSFRLVAGQKSLEFVAFKCWGFCSSCKREIMIWTCT